MRFIRFMSMTAVIRCACLSILVLGGLTNSVRAQTTYTAPKNFNASIPATAVPGSVTVTTDFFGVAWGEASPETQAIANVASPDIAVGAQLLGEAAVPANTNVRYFATLSANDLITPTAAKGTTGTIQKPFFATGAPAGSEIVPSSGSSSGSGLKAEEAGGENALVSTGAVNFTFNSFAGTKPLAVSGNIGSSGSAQQTDTAKVLSTAYGFSYNSARVQYKSLSGVSGSITLAPKNGPTSVDTGQGLLDVASVYDPVIVSAFDETTGQTTQTTLLYTTMDVDGMNNSITWDTTNQVTVTAPLDADFLIDTSMSTFLDPSEQGLLDLQIRNGVVVTSIETGAYASVGLPSVGTLTPNPFTFDVPPLTLDYNLGSFNGDPVDVTLDLSTAGSAFESGDVTPPALPDVFAANSPVASTPLPPALFAFPLAAILGVGFGIKAKRNA